MIPERFYFDTATWQPVRVSRIPGSPNGPNLEPT